MSLKGRGQGVDLGTSTLSLILSIFFSFFGLAFPNVPLNLFPFFVFLSPLPQRFGAIAVVPLVTEVSDGVENNADLRPTTALLATAPHHCITVAISP
ncbi:hypothetical protein OIU79_022048 [Salix purpurea]|uniref:Uncharacterized protein n=1 Tax=Salix purpurea TaxID=77065 RepID=A0A9Q0WFD2_SALPP|nr:hypothetical protein OIU79_022048 [Salix purpurea]